MKKKKIIELFEKVQKIPYKVCKFEKETINENLKEGDCRHKVELLKQLLEKEGFEVKKQEVIFNWKDLPFSEKIIGILKESDTVWKHIALKVKIGEKWIKIDPTWNPELKKKGFPVTENWDGISDTELVTNGKVEFYIEGKCDIKPNIVKEEAHKFALAINQFMSSSLT